MIDFVSVGALIADITIIFIFIMSILLAYRRGFTILVFNLISLTITFIAVLLLFKPLTNFIYDNTNLDEFFSKHIESTIGTFLEEQLEKNNQINTGKTNISRPIAEKINNYIDEVKDKPIIDISKHVANKLSYITISAIVITLLFITIRLLTIFLRAFLHFLSKLPIIHSLDKIGGITYGIIRGFFIIYLILAILSLLSPLLANTGIIAFINNSNICEKFYNNNIFLNILL